MIRITASGWRRAGGPVMQVFKPASSHNEPISQAGSRGGRNFPSEDGRWPRHLRALIEREMSAQSEIPIPEPVLAAYGRLLRMKDFSSPPSPRGPEGRGSPVGSPKHSFAPGWTSRVWVAGQPERSRSPPGPPSSRPFGRGAMPRPVGPFAAGARIPRRPASRGRRVRGGRDRRTPREARPAGGRAPARGRRPR